jgi:dTDP-4-dehydrorhamnose 3,5-epimerase
VSLCAARLDLGMRFEKLQIEGAFTLVPEPAVDERGDFARIFCAREFAGRGLIDSFVQFSVSRNVKRGTVRGLHYQAAPHWETKIVRCTRGALFDVIVDLRRGSATLGRWVSVELSASARNAVYVPAGCAHGFQTLAADCDVEYLITPEYVSAAARGIRWDDASLAIEWPIKEGVTISARDRRLPAFDFREMEKQT